MSENKNNQLMYKRLKKQGGYTIVETLLGAIVAVVVIAGVYAGFNSWRSSHASANFSDNVVQITNGVKQSYQKSQNGYTDIANDMKALIQEKIFPDTLTIDASGGTVKDFGGAVTLASDADTGGFTLNFATVPSDVCMKSLASMGASGFSAIDVNGSNLWTTGSPWPGKTTIAQQCGNGTGDVTITFHAS